MHFRVGYPLEHCVHNDALFADQITRCNFFGFTALNMAARFFGFANQSQDQKLETSKSAGASLSGESDLLDPQLSIYRL